VLYVIVSLVFPCKVGLCGGKQKNEFLLQILPKNRK